MKTSTRLILLLTLLVGSIMAVGGYFRLRQREAVLERAMSNELQAQALTLQIALETAYHAGRGHEAQQLIDSLSKNPKVYGVLVFDQSCAEIMGSNALIGSGQQLCAQVQQVINSKQQVSLTRQLSGQEIYSLLTPLKLAGQRQGAFELAQPTSFINTDLLFARKEITNITLQLCAAILLAVVLVMRYSVMVPIKALLRGAAALGRGDLNYRVPVPNQGSELAQLAQEFNRMADSLAEQRRTAEREAERRLQLERELRDSERLATIGRLAAGVAHEVGTPLNVIDARAEQLQERPDAPLAIRQRNLTIIRAQIDRITRLVRQLLNLARPYHLHCRPVTATALIEGVLELLEGSAAQANVKIMTRLTEARFDVDGELIHQVLLNICQNGLQAMPEGGVLEIDCHSPTLIKNDRSFASISVRDSGHGIAAEHLAHIFDPFFTTKDVGDGTGLGLAVSRRIVEEHSGWITASNCPQGGAKFIIHLPLVETPTALRNQAGPASFSSKQYDQSAFVNR